VDKIHLSKKKRQCGKLQNCAISSGKPHSEEFIKITVGQR
jgi:hypothetical protein